MDKNPKTESLSDFYDKDIENNLFICKSIECCFESTDESEVQIHCRQHLDENSGEDQKTEENGLNDSQSSDQSSGHKKFGKYVCDSVGCNKQFSYLKCFESHKRNEHSVNDNNETKPVTNGSKVEERRSDNNESNDWEVYIETRLMDGKDKLFCKLCKFESNLRVVAKQHIINSHLRQKRIRSRPKIHNEYEYWDKILFDKKGIRLSDEPKVKDQKPVTAKTAANVSPKPVSKTSKLKQKISAKLKTKSIPKAVVKTIPNLKTQNEILAKKHINIDKNRSDVLLSCKGLASMTKVSQYFEKKIISEQTIYCCKWKGCLFRTKKSQKIAEHINLSHIGIEFKCNKPNCNKVFKNPHSYREHQKNHICGFGSFGYGSKGVIGVCRNENLFKYRERILIKGKKYYRCKCCFAITKYFTGIKRHIHSSHICPFRINLHLTRHQTPMAIKKEIMDLDIDYDLFDSKNAFICCIKCNEFFASKEELSKHQIMFCRFKNQLIDENLKNQMPEEIRFDDDFCDTTTEFKPKPKTKLKLSEQIRRNVNAINESIAKNLSLNNQLMRFGPQCQGSVEEYINMKTFEGTDFHLCKLCNFITEMKDTIKEHILNIHFKTESTNGLFEELTESPVFPMNIKVEKLENEENEEFVEVLDLKPSTSGLQSIETNLSIDKYIEIKAIDSEPHYFCSYTKCKFYTKVFAEIKTHVKESHRLFECDVSNCGKQFKSEFALNQHIQNHRCGFGIKGMRASGVCALENIKQYCEEDQSKHQCQWPDCRFLSLTRKNLWSHIHASHVCPNRDLSFDRQSISERKNSSFGSLTSRQSINGSIDGSQGNTSDEYTEDLEVLGTFGTQKSLENFAKYSEEVVIDSKTLYICRYPRCHVTPRNRSYCPEITEKYDNSYVTDFKHNLIRHIRRHCNDKPFVCGINGCEKRFSCSSQHRSHQSSHQ